MSPSSLRIHVNQMHLDATRAPVHRGGQTVQGFARHDDDDAQRLDHGTLFDFKIDSMKQAPDARAKGKLLAEHFRAHVGARVKAPRLEHAPGGVQRLAHYRAAAFHAGHRVLGPLETEKACGVGRRVDRAMRWKDRRALTPEVRLC